MEELGLFTLKLSLVKNISYKKLSSLYVNYNSFADSVPYLIKKSSIKSELAKIDVSFLYKELHKNNISFVCFWEDDYPYLLKECEDRPLILYYVGNKNLLCSKDLLSIVGTRTMTSYGKLLIENLLPAVPKSTVVVSGMAYGVDAYVHKCAIDNDLQTIAVLPTTCHQASPKGNLNIYRRILESGNLAISEHSPIKATHNGLFPMRNRIIAGLAPRTIVIEAGIKSGAIITADIAFSYNRDVFAYPGNINSSMSAGCNYLIKNDIAQLITEPSDLGYAKIDGLIYEKLTEVERKIYYAILPEPKTLNDLSRILGLDINLVSGICTNLQINGILNTDDQNRYYVS